MTAALVVVSYGSSDLVERNVPEQDLPDVMVVLVDNFSDDAERARAQALAARRGWEFVGQPNVGFGGGVNAGCRLAIEAGATELVLLNPDASATPAAIARLVDEVRADPTRLVSPRVVDSAGRVVFRGSTLDLRTGHLRGGWIEGTGDGAGGGVGSVNWLTGACLAFSSAVFTRLDGFADHLFLYWEDVDFSWRAVEAGFRLEMLDDVTVVHDEGGTHAAGGQSAGTSSRPKSDTYYYWNTRNRLAFAADHLPPATVRRWLRHTVGESSQIWLRGGRRQLLSHPAGAWAAVKGTLAGVRKTLPAAILGRKPRSRTNSGAHRRVLVAHPSPDLYGSDRVLLDTARAFVEGGAEVTVTLPATGPLVPLLEQQGARVVVCPSPVVRKSALSPRGLVGFAGEVARALVPTVRLLRRTRPDLVFVNTITIPLWIGVPRLVGRRVVCHVHEAEGGQRALVKKLLYAPLLFTDRLVVNSHYALDVLASAWPALRTRATVVDNPVPGPEDDPAPLRESGDDPRLLFIGRLSPRKGPQVAVDALERLHDLGVPAHLDLLGAVFPGYEWFEDELRQQVSRLGLDDHVTLLGFHPDVWSQIDDHDIVVVPSVADEPFGNTSVEAMLAGRPLVVSDTSGLKEAAADYACARRVPPADPRAIADAVLDLRENWPTVRSSIEADRRRAEARHSPRAYRQTLVQLLLSGAR